MQAHNLGMPLHRARLQVVLYRRQPRREVRRDGLPLVRQCRALLDGAPGVCQPAERVALRFGVVALAGAVADGNARLPAPVRTQAYAALATASTLCHPILLAASAFCTAQNRR